MDELVRLRRGVKSVLQSQFRTEVRAAEAPRPRCAAPVRARAAARCGPSVKLTLLAPRMHPQDLASLSTATLEIGEQLPLEEALPLLPSLERLALALAGGARFALAGGSLRSYSLASCAANLQVRQGG